MADESDGSLTVDALGVRTLLEFGDDVESGVRTDLHRAWSGALATGDGAPDATVPVRAGEPERLKEQISTRVTLAAIEARRGDLLMFHAAGLATPDGRVVTFVGPSGMGKTTLSRTLATRYGYVSDETVAVTSGREVFPYRKPLSIVRQGLPKQQVCPDDLGLLPLPDAPLTLERIILLDRTDDALELSLDPVGLADALLTLVKDLSYLSEVPAVLQRISSLIDSTGGVLRMGYSDSDHLQGAVETILTHASHREDWSGLSLSERTREAGIIDAIDVDGEVILFTDSGRTVALSLIASRVWTAINAGEPPSSVAPVLVEEFGSPPQGDALTMVEKVHRELIDEGYLPPAP